MSNAIHPTQSNTREGSIVAPAAEDLTGKEAHLAYLDDDGAANLDDGGTRLSAYLILEGADEGGDVTLLPLHAGRNVRIVADSAIDAGERVVGEGDGTIKQISATAGTYYSPGFAEESAVEGQLALVRPAPALVTVAKAFTGATPANTAATASTPFGYSEAQANALVANVREIRAALITAGIMAANA